jgi:TolB-like protein/DNA-binding winged helix-turn-helix (wHTH) protein/Tfp pilus assembly protein PilF
VTRSHPFGHENRVRTAYDDGSMDAIRFGPFSLDPRSGELRRDGELVPLAPQPFRLLLALATRPGELVTREELREQVWSDGTFVDFERGLNFCVLQVRTALGDDAKQPSYIETLPRRGYRFVATVDRAAALPPIPIVPPRRRRRFRWTVAAAALLFIVLAIAWQQREPVPPAKVMVAVLPFADLSDRASGGFSGGFADGMTEELITHLGALRPKELGVIARTSILTYRGTKKSIREIGGELGVAYVVEGSIRREADRIRVTAQLIDARDQTHLWAESFDRRGAGALAIQRDVSERIARALRVELLAEDVLSARSPAAHDAYLRGRQLWYDGRTPAVERSVRELREAVRLEPTFVLAHIALAESVQVLAMREQIDPIAARDEIGQAAETALRLAPLLAQSHGIMAMRRFWYDWDWAGAEESYRAAIRFNPNEPGALHDHAWLLISQGRFDEGIAQLRRAQELDPVSPRANMHVAWAYIYTRRYAEAVREARRALDRAPGYEEAYRCLEHAYLLSGDYASALAARRKREPGIAATDARAFFAAERAREAANLETDDPYNAAATLAMAGDRENAIRWLRNALDTHNLSFPLAGVDPKLDSLHGDPRYIAMLRGVGLQTFTPRAR